MTCRNVQTDEQGAEACRFVEVLTTEISGEQIGYGLGGHYPGPNAMITSSAALIEALFERLQQVPTLPWMWGKLYLIEIDGFELVDVSEARRALAEVHFDEIILLPHAKGFANWQTSVDQAYWATLRLCCRLGMIQGRGVHHTKPGEPDGRKRQIIG